MSDDRHESPLQPGAETLVLLPSTSGTLVHAADDRVVLFGPHRGVWVLERPHLVMDVPSDVIKNLFGPVAAVIDARWDATIHPFLPSFEESPEEGAWLALLRDAEDAVTLTRDQRAFREWARQPTPVNRRIERLCARYAGQSPRDWLKVQRFSAEFVANLSHRRYRPLGGFADQSHYIRVCRELTGSTPAALRKLSQLFYWDGRISAKLPAP